MKLVYIVLVAVGIFLMLTAIKDNSIQNLYNFVAGSLFVFVNAIWVLDETLGDILKELRRK